MNYIVPKNNYLVVLPNGLGVGFVDLEEAQAYVNMYCEERVVKEGLSDTYASYDMYEEKSREDIAQVIGCEEGEAIIYNIDDIIEKVQTMDEAFQEEKEEIIGKLISEECTIDTYSLGLESVLVNVDPLKEDEKY